MNKLHFMYLHFFLIVLEKKNLITKTTKWFHYNLKKLCSFYELYLRLKPCVEKN